MPQHTDANTVEDAGMPERVKTVLAGHRDNWSSIVNILNNEGEPFPENGAVASIVRDLQSLSDEAQICCSELGFDQQIACLEHGIEVHLAKVPAVLTNTQVQEWMIAQFNIPADSGEYMQLHRTAVVDLPSLDPADAGEA